MVAAGALSPIGSTAAHAAGTSTISGLTYEDLNRNGVFDAGDTVLTNQHVYLFDSTDQTYLGQAYSDANGHYAMSGLADGTYTVQYAGDSYTSLEENWVPTTTGSLHPKTVVALSGTATVDFGWRQIVRSSSPLSSYTAPNGLVVRVYDDVASPQVVYQTLMSGSMVGKEAATVTIDVDDNSTTFTTTGAAQTNGTYTSYTATTHINWDDYLGDLDNALFHEYGIAWHLYYAYLVQQDPTLTSYLQARGLSGNPNLNSSWMWNQDEIFAEDYRELFGDAAAQAAPQMNTQIPLASQVSGLQGFLATTYQQPPAGGSASTSSAPPPTVALSNLTVSPQPVKSSATISFSQSLAATDTVSITSSSGAAVRTLLSSAAEPQGTVSVTWNRCNSKGKRVPSGSYAVTVTATDASGHTVTVTAAFNVS